MTKDAMIADFYKHYEELKTALKSADVDRIRELSLDVHATIIRLKFLGETSRPCGSICWRWVGTPERYYTT